MDDYADDLRSCAGLNSKMSVFDNFAASCIYMAGDAWIAWDSARC